MNSEPEALAWVMVSSLSLEDPKSLIPSESPQLLDR